MKYKLSDKAVKNAKGQKYFADGGGLYLKLTETGSKSWVFRWWDKSKAKAGERGRLREMGLGGYPVTSLAEARQMAEAALEITNAGGDPIRARDVVQHDTHAAILVEVGQVPQSILIFSRAAEKYIAEMVEPTSKSKKHVAQWRATIETYCNPIIGHLPLEEIEEHHVLEILQPQWATKTETMQRVMQRLCRILDWAKARKYRSGENPARWAGNLEFVLPNPSKLKNVQHMRSLPYSQLYGFLKRLAQHEGTSARALEFLIFTAARTSEVLCAEWSEIDFAERVWTIPASRTKMNREHRVPLSPQALRILHSQKGEHELYIFPGANAGHLSNMSLLMLVRGIDVDAVPHGFRGSFKTWAAEMTSFQRDVVELSLAHVNRDRVEAAYLHGDMLERRRKVMNAWAKFATTEPAGVVVPLKKAK